MTEEGSRKDAKTQRHNENGLLRIDGHFAEPYNPQSSE
jgi:hypothetical protein